jgi:hypothetical protein
VVEVRVVEPSVIHVLALPRAIERATAVAPRALAATVTSDELLLVGDSDRDRIARAVAEVDPHGLVLDVGDGWSAWTLAGPDAREAFVRLSELELPDQGFVQGEVARLPVKVMVHDDVVTMLVPAMWSDHLGVRIRTDCAALGVREATT